MMNSMYDMGYTLYDDADNKCEVVAVMTPEVYCSFMGISPSSLKEWFQKDPKWLDYPVIIGQYEKPVQNMNFEDFCTWRNKNDLYDEDQLQKMYDMYPKSTRIVAPQSMFKLEDL